MKSYMLVIWSLVAVVATAQTHPDIRSISAEGTNILIQWELGSATHVVEMATDLTNEYIIVSPVFSGLSAEVFPRSTNPIAFFRVRSVQAINVADPALAKALQEKLAGKVVSRTGLYDIDLIRVEDLHATRGLTSLDGIQNAPNLAFLDLGYTNWNVRNHIQDISFLTTLTNLTSLNLNGNEISDITPLSALTNLKSLEIGWNHISDISPLAHLKNLSHLRINQNQITNADNLCHLPELRYLEISNNPKSDYSSLRALTNLEQLIIAGNNISNLAFVSRMQHLTKLYASWNPITTLEPLANIHSLKTLYLYDVKITDLRPLVENALAGGLSTGAVLHLHGMPLNDMVLAQQVPLLEKMGVKIIR